MTSASTSSSRSTDMPQTIASMLPLMPLNGRQALVPPATWVAVSRVDGEASGIPPPAGAAPQGDRSRTDLFNVRWLASGPLIALASPETNRRDPAPRPVTAQPRHTGDGSTSSSSGASGRSRFADEHTGC